MSISSGVGPLGPLAWFKSIHPSDRWHLSMQLVKTKKKRSAGFVRWGVQPGRQAGSNPPPPNAMVLSFPSQKSGSFGAFGAEYTFHYEVPSQPTPPINQPPRWGVEPPPRPFFVLFCAVGRKGEPAGEYPPLTVLAFVGYSWGVYNPRPAAQVGCSR